MRNAGSNVLERSKCRNVKDGGSTAAASGFCMPGKALDLLFRSNPRPQHPKTPNNLVTSGSKEKQVKETATYVIPVLN